MRKILQEIIKEIKEKYDPIKIILYGSYAYGEPTEDSDIDLLIIKDTNKRPIDRWVEIKKILRNVSRKTAVSPLVYNPGEIEERMAMKDFFMEEIFEKGKVLYGRSL
ncbi:MAG: nucleotidyltransferase domain-containing protein [Armatimonadota bacterium]